MKVKFLMDYRGHLTDEKYYLEDSIVDFATSTAEQLIKEGRVEIVEDAPPSDDLTQIDGVGSLLADMLVGEGVTTFSSVAKMETGDLTGYPRIGKLKAIRIIASAKKLAGV